MPTVGHCQGDKLTHSMLIIASNYSLFDTKNPAYKWSLDRAEDSVRCKPTTFRFWYVFIVFVDLFTLNNTLLEL